MHLTRRQFLHATAAATLASTLPQTTHAASSSRVRRFHACSNTAALDADPDLLDLFVSSGVDAVWLPAFFYGYWPYPLDHIAAWRERIHARGLQCELANIPLGHPGDSLGAPGDSVPLTPGETWRMAVRPDGTQYSGTSLHPPATQDNVEAVKRLRDLGANQIFLDDDFRLATGPGIIGGCFCDDHKAAFLKKGGYSESQWDELLADVNSRNLSPILRAWVESTCDELTACFRAQQAAAPEVELGNMIMYFGAEKAGIRLVDYKDALFRVGELMFNDNSFAPIKGKTNELYSCLFHRRYTTPERAYSETTAYPADQLSAPNMSAKLAVSTIADVRNTMYMSGLTPIPNAHWATLTPAMKKHAAIHEQLAGHRPQGPYKHYWGEASRYIGDDNPYSLFLATGIPFEVVDTPSDSGYIFLSDWDAQDLGSGKLAATPATFIARTTITDRARPVPEDLESLYALKHELAGELRDIPHVIDDIPIVCAWYPTANKVLLWNLTEQPQTITLAHRNQHIPITLSPLDVELAPL